MIRRYFLFFAAVIGFSFFPVEQGLTHVSQDEEHIHPVPADSPQKGIFLVASPNMSDPRFQQSVILLLAHDDNGSLGLIINRPTSIALSEALPRFQSSDQRKHLLFFGGPVAMGNIIFLIHDKTPISQTLPVLNDIYASGNAQILDQVLNSDVARQLRIYFGHAGWAPGQLDAELARNGWYLFQAEPEAVFYTNPDTLWESFMGKQKAPRILVLNGEYDYSVISRYRR